MKILKFLGKTQGLNCNRNKKIHMKLSLRQVSGIKYLNKMITYHLAHENTTLRIENLRRLDDSFSQTRIHFTYLS